MKRALFVLVLLCAPALAQGATRTVVISFTASTSTSVTQTAIYACTVPTGGTSCTPNISGTPIGTVAAGCTNCSFTTTETVNTAYGYSVVPQAPACGPNSPVGTACGNAAPAGPNYVPVPPNPNGATNVVVVVP